MPQETSNVMSTYEIIATVIAVIALIQPWAIKLWNTLFIVMQIMLTLLKKEIMAEVL